MANENYTSQDIRELGDVGRSHINLSLDSVAENLPIPAALKDPLREISQQLQDEAYRIIGPKADEREHHEGRGRYSDCTIMGHRIHVYTKGVGNRNALIENEGKPLGMFGPRSGSWGWLYDFNGNKFQAPRIIVAMYEHRARKEFAAALYVLVNFIEREKEWRRSPRRLNSFAEMSGLFKR